MIKRLFASLLLVLMTVSAVMAQNPVVITGSVLADDGEPLPGATVAISGTSNATATDIDGRFTLKVPAAKKDGKIHVSYIGMRPVEMAISMIKGPVEIRLQDDDNRLEEVIVTGYATLSKERATGSFGTISSKKLESKLATNLADRLEGQMAGVVLNKDGSMSIRGRATLNAETDPLVVVDGYPTELKLSDLNPDNISNITVLKDAVAASIYGSRSANGVIIVSTRQGEEGKMKVSYRGSLKVLPKPDLDYLHMAGASDYIDAEIELYNQNPGGTTIANRGTMSEVSTLIAKNKAGMISDAEYNAGIEALRQNDFLADMKKYMFRTELTQTHNLGISGGSSVNRYNLAVNYTNTKGAFINTHSNRVIIDLNNEWKPFRFLTVGVGASISYSRSHAPNTGWQTYTNYGQYIKPYSRLMDANGNLTNLTPLSYASQQLYDGIAGSKDMYYNPIQDSYDSYNKTATFGARVNGFVRFNIMEGLYAEVGGNWNRSNSTYRAIFGSGSYVMRNAYNSSTSMSNPTNHYIPDGDAVNETRYTSEDWTLRTQISYSKSFGLHRVSALAGNEVRRISYDNNQYATRFGYNSTAGSFSPVNIKDLASGTYNSDMIGGSAGFYPEYGEYSLRDNRFVSWYFNGSYEFNNRYLVSGSVREDLTNFFGTDPKYRHKPLWSVGGTWKIANEDFFNAGWVDRLNLRASYGVNGNISLSEGPYLILSAGSFNPTTGGVSNGISSFPNNSLRWEKTRTTNVGVDFDVFGNRLGISLDYYYKKSTDILAADATDPTTGTSRMTRNLGAIDNRGVEISLHGTPVRSSDFSWDIMFNMSFNKNKVVEYNVARNYPTSWAWSQAIHAAGHPMFGLFGYNFAGIDDRGMVTVYGKDGDVKYAQNANVDDIIYLGTAVPTTELSVINALKYRNWDLSFMFIAKLGHKYRKDVFQGSNINSRFVAQRWQKPGDENHTIYPALSSWNSDLFYFPYCDVNIGNASYAKLRDLTIAYTFDRSLINSIGMSEARIYLQGRNLFRITAKGVDIDPETMEMDYSNGVGASSNAGFSVLPRSAEYYVGMSFSF
ncbi:SusC/RagA family TonB-linked outer membrane protein [Duncaniella freteri]|uniref:SusC/RagA family TonB-linked outer membrane protein n=1 Tax=Duncaniella freteri TaxID=2530391 RepID=UPI0025757B22|nr:SusC/RagA family TonB-linked outer membrane protein [Duncaniella freteri]